jgi:ferritin-like metal-binding protein YciE
MEAANQKIVQYLNEAQASERALVRVLQSQIAMTPRGTYRTALESHLTQTRSHVRRIDGRLGELGHGENVVQAVVGVVEGLVGQAIALSKTPIDMLRGSGGEEKLLKNAKDTCATEALEIATYTALGRLADATGDTDTARLAASIRKEEETMLARVLREIPKLTDAVIGSDIRDEPSYDITTTGAADTARAAADSARDAATSTVAAAKRASRQARKVPGVARAEGQIKGAVASAGDLAIAGYDDLTADEITTKLAELSQIELAKIDAYERKHDNRTTVLSRITTLRANEPWPGYDELTVAEVQSALSRGDDDRATEVRSYERSHKNRAGVLKVADRAHANAA